MMATIPARPDKSGATRSCSSTPLAAAVLLVACGIAQPSRALADVIIFVDTASDVIANDGFCSLREAITAANNNGNYFGCLGNGGGYDLIELSIGAGTPVINVATALPIIRGPVEINGGPNRVELRGPGTGSGLYIDGSVSAGSVIRGLVINGFAQGIDVQSTSNITIAGNRIGTNAAGTAAAANQVGIRIQYSTNTQVGGTGGVSPGGSCTGDCNLISGNTSRGIYVAGSSPTTIRGNLIGTNAGGTAAIANGTGVRSEVSSSVIVGGATAGAGNVIAGNTADAISIQQGPATIQGNRIGTNAAGSGALPNGTGVSVNLENDFHVVNVGGSAAGAGNLISGNTGAGILLLLADDVLIQGNRIGTQDNGTGPLANGGAGVQLSSSTHDNSIGGISPGQANVIAYNATGVTVGINNYDNSVVGNSIRDNVGKGIALADYQSASAFAPLISGVSPVTGTACPGCIVHVYSDAADEGAVYQGNVVADGAGNWSYSGAVVGPFVTATATNGNGGTSEFSSGYPASPPDTDGDGVPNTTDNCTLVVNSTQLDADGDGYGNICDADLNNSGQVTAADFSILRSVLNQAAGSSTNAAKADLNGSGTVTAADFSILRARLNTAPGPSGLAP